MKAARTWLRSSATLVALLLFPFSSFPQYSAEGPLSGSMFSNDNSIGSFPFSIPGNAIASDNNRSTASALLVLLNGNTHYLKVTGFGFSIPALSTITGIRVEVEKSAWDISILATVKDNSIRLVKAGIPVGNNKADGSSWNDSDNYNIYGDTTDDWGALWTPEDINAADFGVVFSAKIAGLVSLIPTARVDHIRVTVFYITALPIHFISFNADAKKKREVLLSWKTADNDERVLFTVQRSVNGSSWTDLALLAGDVSSGIRQYSYTDHIININDHFYYRVKMDLLSGHSVYTRILLVNTRQAELFKVFPNPANDHIDIICGENENIDIFSIDGIKINLQFQKLSNTEVRINTSFLRPGLYIIKIGSRQQRLIIQ